jgi:hypothetical protein
MKTPWSKLLQYGAGFATIVVLCIAGIILMSVVGVGVLLTKFSDFIR